MTLRIMTFNITADIFACLLDLNLIKVSLQDLNLIKVSLLDLIFSEHSLLKQVTFLKINAHFT